MARDEAEGSGRGSLLAQALARANMAAAWKRVKANRGSAGVDGLSIAETAEYLKTHWPRIREALLDGSYRPAPVRRVQIPKPAGGVRELGIPTVTDRLIQQALLQVLQPLIDPTFSEHSYGFRPGRRAHDAVLRARQHVQDGYRTVVDVDLEKFFDRVNHDILMHRLARRIDDKAVLRLIRRYLEAGIMDGGLVVQRHEGTPQGGLDDAPLERAKHRGGGGPAPSLRAGWKAYFQLAQTPGVFRKLDEWLRHRLRALQLKHWRRGKTMYRELLAMGASKENARLVAANSRCWWRNSYLALNRTMPIAYFDLLGVPRLS